VTDATPAPDKSRSPGGSAARAWDIAFGVLINVAIFIVLLTVRDYGISFDEEVQLRYGEHLVDYYASGFEDLDATTYGDLYLYGGLFELLATLATRVLPIDPFTTRHLLGALVGLLGVVGLWKLIRVLGGPRAAFFAALFLLLTSRYYGDMFLNPKDVPFAVGYVWSLYYLVRVFGDLPRPAWSLLVRTGLAFGLTLGIRVGGLLLFAYLGLLLGVHALGAVPRTRGAIARLGLLLRLATGFLVVVLVAWPVMLAFWPWAQQAPLSNPFVALEKVTHFAWPGRVLLDGAWYPATDLPWTYAVHWLAITLPEAILLLLGIGAALGLIHTVRRRRRRAGEPAPRATAAAVAFVIFAIVFPLVYVAVRKSVLYHGIRHLLFVVPPLVGLAALSLEALLRQGWAQRWPGRLGVAAFVLWFWLPAAHALVHLHPLQYVYFNRLVGGVAGAVGRYNGEYWRASFREAVSRLCEHLEQEAGGGRPEDYRVLMGGKAISSWYYFPDYLSVARTPDEVDFVIHLAESKDFKWLPGPPLLGVYRYGAWLAVVRDCRKER